MSSTKENRPASSDRELVEFARELVRTPSVLGDERQIAEYVAERMRRLGFDYVEIDAAGNAVGVVQGGAGAGPTVLFDGHLDTVDVVPLELWHHEPFGGEVVDGRLYGRGSADMKGALAAMVYAAAALDRSRLAARIVVSGSVGEELLEGAALSHVMNRLEPDFVVIGEPSNLNLVRAGRGRAELVIQTHGQPAHASTPERGVNAVHRMLAAIAEIERLEMPVHPFLGHGVLCLTDIISVPYPAHSVVPSGCRATYERRLLLGESQSGVIAELTAGCERAGLEDFSVELAQADYRTYTGYRWRSPKWLPAWELPEKHRLTQRALVALRQEGLRPDLSSYQFCTNAAYSAGIAGVPTIGFGPSQESQAHIVDEYLEVDQLALACRGYRAIAQALAAP